MFWEFSWIFFAPIPGGGHATFRGVLFMRITVPMLRSTPLVSSQMKPWRYVQSFRSLKFPEFSPCLGGPHATSSTCHCSTNVARNWINYTGICKSTFQLSFALLFSSIRALSAKRTISNFRSNSRRVTWNHPWTDVAPSGLLQLQRTYGIFALFSADPWNYFWTIAHGQFCSDNHENWRRM
jgi:hypothetical protein